MLSDARRDFFDAFGHAGIDADRCHDAVPGDETGSELCRAAQESGVWGRSDAVFGRVRDGAAG